MLSCWRPCVLFLKGFVRQQLDWGAHFDILLFREIDSIVSKIFFCLIYLSPSSTSRTRVPHVGRSNRLIVAPYQLNPRQTILFKNT